MNVAHAHINEFSFDFIRFSDAALQSNVEAIFQAIAHERITAMSPAVVAASVAAESVAADVMVKPEVTVSTHHSRGFDFLPMFADTTRLRDGGKLAGDSMHRLSTRSVPGGEIVDKSLDYGSELEIRICPHVMNPFCALDSCRRFYRLPPMMLSFPEPLSLQCSIDAHEAAAVILSHEQMMFADQDGGYFDDVDTDFAMDSMVLGRKRGGGSGRGAVGSAFCYRWSPPSSYYHESLPPEDIQRTFVAVCGTKKGVIWFKFRLGL